MKTKTALVLSLAVNVVVLTAIGYFAATEVELETTPAFIFVTNAPSATASAAGSITVASH
ncbi:MAG: hypothetical protein QM813_10040 [Verrucomicrobiota bacterium]